MKRRLSVGELIRAKRQEQECSQEAVAMSIGVSIRFISLIENGDRQLPLNHFQAVAQFLDIPLKELFNAKMLDEENNAKMRKMRKELNSEGDQVSRAIQLHRMKEMRAKEIDEFLRFLEMQRQEHIAQIKISGIEKQRIEAQIKILNEEKELLGFGQLEMKLEA